uniref:Uncharacterized protein n=1 Tax=Daphnia magna TaxID=35525 RepID=A0A0P5V1R3_9CRUS
MVLILSTQLRFILYLDLPLYPLPSTLLTRRILTMFKNYSDTLITTKILLPTVAVN